MTGAAIRHVRRTAVALLVAVILPASLIPLPSFAGGADTENKTKVKEAFVLADALFYRKKYLMAAREYRDALNKYPASPSAPKAYLKWSECERKTGDSERALKLLEGLRKRYRDTPEAEHARANMAAILNRAGKADAVLKLLAAEPGKKVPDTVKEAIYYYRSVAYYHKGRWKEALSQLSRLNSRDLDPLHPHRAYARVAAATIHRGQGRYEQAEGVLKPLADDLAVASKVREEAIFHLAEIAYVQDKNSVALTYYTRILVNHPDGDYVVKALLQKSRCLIRLKKYNAAVELFSTGAGKKALKLADGLYLNAVALEQSEKCVRALVKFRKLLDDYPDSELCAHAEVGIIECRFLLKRYRECIEAAEKLVKARPDHSLTPDAWFYLGRSHRALGEPEKAAAALETALKRYGTIWNYREEALGVLARIYLDSGRFKQAAITYRRFTEIKGSAFRSKALLMAAECEVKAGDNTAALRDCEKLIEMFPGTAERPLAMENLAELHVRLKAFDSAIVSLDQFLKEYPEHAHKARALYLRGTVYYRLNKYDEAIADLKTALKIPDFDLADYARLFLAYAYWENNQEDEALNLFEPLLNSAVLKENLAPILFSEIGSKYLGRNDLNSAQTCFELLAESENAAVKVAGLLGLGQVKFARKKWDDARKTFHQVKKMSADDPTARAIAMAYLGESSRQLKRYGEAEVALDEAIELGIGDSHAAAMARYARAELYLEKKDRDNAVRYAVSVFVLYNDPKYVPKAILLAIRLLVEDKRLEDARKFGKELADRFPAAYEDAKDRAEYAPALK